MERAHMNTATMVPKATFGAGTVGFTREWNVDRRKDRERIAPGKPVLFNVELLHDAVWGGETEWTALALHGAERAAWRRQPAFFNVELLHDAVWEG